MTTYARYARLPKIDGAHSKNGKVRPSAADETNHCPPMKFDEDHLRCLKYAADLGIGEPFIANDIAKVLPWASRATRYSKLSRLVMHGYLS